MSLGFETYEDNRNFEKSGLTGVVKRYTTESIEYPCFIITLSDSIAKYKLDVLRRMFAMSGSFNENLTNLSIGIYFDSGDNLIKFGKIYPAQVKSFLKLFETEKIIGFYSKDKVLENEYLYVLAE